MLDGKYGALLRYINMLLIYLLVFNANLFIKHKREYVVNTIFQRIFLARH